MSDITTATLRYMAWEEAKGKMNAMLQTYWSHDDDKYEAFKREMEAFIKKVEDNELHA